MNTVLNIDSGAFLKTQSEFFFQPTIPRNGVTELEDYNGNLHVYTRYANKESFKIDFAELDEPDITALVSILDNTGATTTHSVRYETPDLIKLYDGSTAASGLINRDVARVRKKVLIQTDGFIRIEGHPNKYKCTLMCREV